METARRRVLRRFHNATNDSASRKPRIPSQNLDPPVPPGEAIKAMAQSSYFKFQWDQVNQVPKIFTAMVFPSHLEMHGPQAPPQNFITETYNSQADRFLRVRFLENDGKPFRMEPGINPDEIIERHISKVLKGDTPLFDPVLFGAQKFQYLSYIISSLKKRKMIMFYREDDNVSPTSAEEIRNKIGTWSEIDPRSKSPAKVPWKWGARISLAFITSIPIQELDKSQWECRPDEPKGAKYPNTDGCGMISQSLADKINTVLKRQGYHPSQAFQIRFGGVKGVVHTASSALFKALPNKKCDLVLRESQLKFDVSAVSGNIMFRIVSTAAEPQGCLFSPPVLKALEDLGCNTWAIEELFQKAFDTLSSLTGNTIDLLREILRVPVNDSGVELCIRDSLLKFVINMKARGILP
ncbi:RNA-dependent RNA polymerase 1 [Apiospora phragmitis]|uniref:RNA-dependent RNA polymerase n=1 Tax=Apiospora phragmitis TaxID=2905665 RepID=A0ABR1V0B8_9PEZI